MRNGSKLLARLGVLAGLLVFSAPASAATHWDLMVNHHETNAAPGGSVEYWVTARNVGTTASNGPVTVTVDLPAGVTRHSVVATGIFGVFGFPPASWDCPGSAGDTTIICTHAAPVLPGASAGDPPGPTATAEPNFVINAQIDPGAAGAGTAMATVSGGGAPTVDTVAEVTPISAAAPGFGLAPGTWEADFFAPDAETPVREAGSHPSQASFAFGFNTVKDPEFEPPPGFPTEFRHVFVPDESVRRLAVDLPLGFVGNPTAVGQCTEAQLSAGFGSCPRSSQVGRIELDVSPPGKGATPSRHLNQAVYNMVHPKGVITDLAFAISNLSTVHIRASLDPRDYHVRTTVDYIVEAGAYNQKLTIWGVPGDPSHDFERCISKSAIGSEIETLGQRCPIETTPKPFLTTPGRCDVDQTITIRNVDSWQNPGVFEPSESTPVSRQKGCERLRFEPELSLQPVSQAANTPTGLDVHLEVPQNDNPNALETAHVKSTTVTFPEGMTVSPSFADGLQACSQEQIALGTDDSVRCPDASRIGTVDMSTPLLPQPLKGSLYLAKQVDNPYGTLLAMYLVVRDTEERGVLVKVPAKMVLDPVSGRLTTTFDDLPQLPYDDLTLHFRSGPRAPLINPPSCGTQVIEATMTSWAQPDEEVDVSDSYKVTEGPDGTPCPGGRGSRPLSPKLSAGTVNPSAGAFSPFVFRVTRSDDEQEVSRISTTLPPGLVAKLKGIPYCPESALAEISSQLGAGLEELNSPRCPAASQVGSVSVGVGAGPTPNYFPGKVYLAGPYKGAPLSLMVVIAGLAGPFDLGNVAVRTTLRVDRTTAQVSAVSDPLPLILHGVLLRVRDIRIYVDRRETVLNPTSCEPMAVTAQVNGVGSSLLTDADDPTAVLADRFQVGNCANLGFAPKLKLSLKGQMKRSGNPALKAVLTQPPGQANIDNVQVILPQSAFIDQAHVNNPCTRPQFEANTCPPSSVLGTATAYTPLLDEPLTGNVYFRSNGGERDLPDIVAALRGQIAVDLVGYIDAVENRKQGTSRVRNTFALVPDAPVTRFVMNLKGGKSGLIENSANLCKVKQNKATVKMDGQNGKVHDTKPVVAPSSCGKKSTGKRR